MLTLLDLYCQNITISIEFVFSSVNEIYFVIYRFIGFVSYYGHASNTSNLGKDMHLSFIFAALVEVPAFSIPFIINYNGRRWTLFSAFLAAGGASLFYAFVPSGMFITTQIQNISRPTLTIF